MELTLMAGFIVMMDCWKGLAEMSTSSTSSLFWNKETDQGFSSVGMVLALLISLALLFTCAKVYEINTVSARVQETADAAVLAAENTVGEFYIVVTVCDAITFTLSLTSLVVLAIGVVCACIPPTATLSKGLLDASVKIGKARDSFYESAQNSLETLQKALPFIATAKAQEVLLANSAEGKSHYYGIVVLAPWEGTVGEPLVFEKSTQAQNSAQEKHQTLVDQAEKAEEAAQQANEWKEKAYIHDSGSKSEYCMYERAASLADMSGVDNPYFSSIDTWSFQAALSRSQQYYKVRYEIEQPQGSSIEEQSNSALRKNFYAFAVKTVGEGYVHETDNSFEASFPTLPKNTDEMRLTSLYSDAIYPKTQNEQGLFSLHAWEGCPGCSNQTRVGSGSIQEMDGSGAYATCPHCKFSASSMGKVAAASSNIENGFEYHYNEVAHAAEEYEKARLELDPLSKSIKDTAQGLFDTIFEGISEVSAKRLKILPPGHWGAIALVVDLSASSSRFVSTFAGSEDVSMLGVRAALSASTLVRESSDEGKNTITSFLDGIDSQNAAVGTARVVLDLWSGLLEVYADGHEAMRSAIEQALNAIPLASASGLGTWAADTFEQRIDEVGFSPPDLLARKAALVNSAHVLSADDSSFSVQLLSMKNAAINYGEGGINGAVSAAETLASSVVDALSAEFEIATIVLLEGKVEIPITVSLPSWVTSNLSSAFQAGIDQLYSVVASWTGVRQWR